MNLKIKPDEKECPFCAEIIKKKATKCRFCKELLDLKTEKKVKKTPKVTKPKKRSFRYACPICKSENVKKASLVKDEGTFSGKSSIKGVGISSDGSIGAGFGSKNLNYKSDLAKNVKSVDEKNCGEEIGGYIGAFFGLIAGFAIGFAAESFWLGLIVTFGVTIFGTVIGKKSSLGQSEKERISQDQRNYQNSYICLKCGHQYTKY